MCKIINSVFPIWWELQSIEFYAFMSNMFYILFLRAMTIHMAILQTKCKKCKHVETGPFRCLDKLLNIFRHDLIKFVHF